MIEGGGLHAATHVKVLASITAVLTFVLQLCK
jgi:hypothetical protein